MNRLTLALLLLGAGVTPVAASASPVAVASAETADDLALDIARAYLDPAIYGPTLRQGFLGEIDLCLSSGKLSASDAAAKREVISTYIDSIIGGFGKIHAAMADVMRPAFTTAELGVIDTFLRSKAGRNMLGITVSAVILPMTARYSPCKLQGPVPSLKDAIAKAMAAVSDEDMAAIGRFGASPAGKKFLAFGPQLRAAMSDPLAAVVAEALQRSGIGQDFTA